MSLGNYGLRDEIEAYWSRRAETFDLSPGHEIFSQGERRAWHRLIRRHLGEGAGRRALDLASGTGVVAQLMDELGFRVTGLDWSEPMLARARAKAAARGRAIAFRHGDAERILEDDGAFDVAVTRHLVWTLVDPSAAFREWLRVLRPGGVLLVVDGDFVATGRAERLLMRLDALARRAGLGGREPASAHHAPDMAAAHRSILERVHFSGGARAADVARLLEAAGFEAVTIDARLSGVRLAQARHFGLLKGLARATQHRYAIRAVKPA